MEELVFEKSVCVCVHMCLTVLLHACDFTRVGEGESIGNGRKFLGRKNFPLS